MNYKFIAKALKLIKPILSLKNKISAILPKKKKGNEFDELKQEIEQLRKDLKSHERKIKKLTTKEFKVKETKTKKEVYIQAELYTSVVDKGKNGGSESGGYILINLPLDDWNKIRDKFNNMDSYKLKEMLGIPENKVLKNVDKGETESDIQESFLEINGKRKPLNLEAF